MTRRERCSICGRLAVCTGDWYGDDWLDCCAKCGGEE